MLLHNWYIIENLFSADLGLPRKHAEFVGNVAVMGEEEVAPPVKDAPPPSNKDAPVETTTSKAFLLINNHN